MTLRFAAFAIVLAASVASAAVVAPVPKDQLMVPPPDAQHCVIASESNTHGSEWRWKTADCCRSWGGRSATHFRRRRPETPQDESVPGVCIPLLRSTRVYNGYWRDLDRGMFLVWSNVAVHVPTQTDRH